MLFNVIILLKLRYCNTSFKQVYEEVVINFEKAKGQYASSFSEEGTNPHNNDDNRFKHKHIHNINGTRQATFTIHPST
uniref:Putative secreted protein n=1 Tax=Anopheles marajoara TaxID=58244 RepID=A0A2M4CCD0_9DIPT